MKKLFVFLLMIVMKDSIAQIPQNFYCPCGYQLSFMFNKLNFHKPRTDCQNGFGFCARLGEINVKCVPCNGSSGLEAPRMNGNDVEAYFKYDCGQMTLHLPKVLAEDEIFKGEDVHVFEVEERSVCLSGEAAEKPVWVRGGIYPVNVQGEELVIAVDLD
jgi:hypothetical protein